VRLLIVIKIDGFVEEVPSKSAHLVRKLPTISVTPDHHKLLRIYWQADQRIITELFVKKQVRSLQGGAPKPIEVKNSSVGLL